MISENRDKSPKKTLSIVTYNFFIRPPGVGKKEYKNLRCARFPSFLYERGFNNPTKPLFNIDAICFQEIFTPFNNRRKKLIKGLSQVLDLKY